MDKNAFRTELDQVRFTPAGREALLAEYNRLKRMVADGGILEVEA